MKSRCIYFDYQSSTPLDKEVYEFMKPFWFELHGNPHSNEHAIGWSADKVINSSKQNIANMIGCDADEIFFTSGATEANNLAIKGYIKGNQTSPKRKHILLTEIDHKCVIEAVKSTCSSSEYSYDFISVDKEGYINLEELEEKASSDVLLFSYILVNNEIGTIQDSLSIDKICRKNGISIHTDAAQAPYSLDISKISSNVDLLSLSAHKMYGPMGIGALFISREIQKDIYPLIHGGGQQDNVRSGTLPLPLCAGMGKASEICSNKIDSIQINNIKNLRDKFVKKVLDLDENFFLNGPPLNNRHIGNANIRFANYSAQDLIGLMQPKLAVSSGSACSSGITEPSHVLRAIGLNKDDSEASIRFSIGKNSVLNEIETAVTIVKETIAKYE